MCFAICGCESAKTDWKTIEISNNNELGCFGLFRKSPELCYQVVFLYLNCFNTLWPGEPYIKHDNFHNKMKMKIPSPIWQPCYLARNVSSRLQAAWYIVKSDVAPAKWQGDSSWIQVVSIWRTTVRMSVTVLHSTRVWAHFFDKQRPRRHDLAPCDLIIVRLPWVLYIVSEICWNINSLRPSDAYMRQYTNHNWFR